MKHSSVTNMQQMEQKFFYSIIIVWADSAVHTRSRQISLTVKKNKFSKNALPGPDVYWCTRLQTSRVSAL